MKMLFLTLSEEMKLLWVNLIYYLLLAINIDWTLTTWVYGIFVKCIFGSITVFYYLFVFNSNPYLMKLKINSIKKHQCSKKLVEIMISHASNEILWTHLKMLHSKCQQLVIILNQKKIILI